MLLKSLNKKEKLIWKHLLRDSKSYHEPPTPPWCREARIPDGTSEWGFRLIVWDKDGGDGDGSIFWELLHILAQDRIIYSICFMLCFPKGVHVTLKLTLSRNECSGYTISTNVENPSNYVRIWCCSNPLRHCINCAVLRSVRFHFFR